MESVRRVAAIAMSAMITTATIAMTVQVAGDIVVVVFVTFMLNVLLQRLTAPSLRVGRIGA